MKTFKYVPELAQGEHKLFDGHIELKRPMLEEQIEMSEKMGVEIEHGGEINVAKAGGNLVIFKNMLKLAREYYVAVDLKNLKTGEEYKSYEDLSCDPDCHGMVSEIAALIVNGKKVGNA